ncbi:hypothetical protein [Stakelama tenebrarum]|uniref:Uncharacterized protein n=1 Tax=Stakelama tenebrarum TaxID=2711215 RepID=A0A6G6Y6E8_9SPHN|nr:hypothetical protein [Sphingosinithalassobacter tenebrarum]QIG80524.1 hypothetical protein G5C33_12525 [Sphingosinithalassobacter tenebrarum]
MRVFREGALAFAILVAGATPSLAQDSDKAHGNAALTAASGGSGTAYVSGFDSEEAHAFGAWINRFNDAARISLSQVSGLQAAWNAASQSGDVEGLAKRFRPTLERTRAAITQSNAALRALDTPEFPGLDLAEPFQPARLVEQMLALNEQLSGMLDQFERFAEAVSAHDRAAMMQSIEAFLRTTKMVIESRRLLAEAELAAIDPQSSDYEYARFNVVLLGSGVRVLESLGLLLNGGDDPAFDEDLARMADEIDAIVAEGRRKLGVEMAAVKTTLASARGAEAESLERRRRMQLLDAEVFDLAAAYAAMLRAAGEDIRSHGLSMERLQPLSTRMNEARMQLNQIVLRQNAIFSGEE